MAQLVIVEAKTSSAISREIPLQLRPGPGSGQNLKRLPNKGASNCRPFKIQLRGAWSWGRYARMSNSTLRKNTHCKIFIAASWMLRNARPQGNHRSWLKMIWTTTLKWEQKIMDVGISRVNSSRVSRAARNSYRYSRKNDTCDGKPYVDSKLHKQ